MGATAASTALRSRTAGRCAGQGCPPSEQERGSETIAVSVSLSQGALFLQLGLCELEGPERREC